ncbi:MAG: LamG-like jellyroll fold domain-containing protein [Bacteroidia bacterium]
MKKNLLFTFAAICLSLCVKAQVPTLNLEAEYRFSTNADDTGPNNYDGMNVGATLTADRFGNMNAAYDFSSAGYIDCNDVLDGVLAGSGKKFTISFWVKPAGTNANNFVLSKHADAGCGLNERQFFIRILSDKVNVEYYGDNAGTMGRFICGTTTLTNTSHWYNVVVTYDGTINTNNGLDRVRIYVDNVAETTSLSCRTQSGTFPFDIPVGPARFGIGNYLTSGGSACLSSTRYNGIIDDIRIYSRLLTSSEITQLYGETTAGIGDHPSGLMLDVFPNPASTQFTVTLKPLHESSVLAITNVLGEEIARYKLNPDQKSAIVETDDLKDGVYFVCILSDGRKLASKKVIVVK